MKAAILFILSLFILSSCAPAAGQSSSTLTPAARPTAQASLAPQPSAVLPPAIVTPFPTLLIIQPPTPTANAAGLIIQTRPIKDLQSGPLLFMSMDGQKFDSSALGQGGIAAQPAKELALGYKGGLLAAAQQFNHDYSQGWVTVSLAGRAIYQIYTGPASTIFSLRGLYTFAACTSCPSHWLLETATIQRQLFGHGIEDQGTGQLVEDGSLLNKKYGYQTAFNFQLLSGKPFYFFQRIPSLKNTSAIDAWYNGLVIPLGYDEIPHYGYGDASQLNPRLWPDHVVFFARRGAAWYLVQISAQ